jgi:hypothetical protein
LPRRRRCGEARPADPQLQEPEAELEDSFRPPTGAAIDQGLFDDILRLASEPPPQAPQAPSPQPPPAGSRRPREQREDAGAETPPERLRIRPPAQGKRESLASRIARAAQVGERDGPAPASTRSEPPRLSPPQRAVATRPPASGDLKRHSESAEFRPPSAALPPPGAGAALPPREVESRWDLPPDTGIPLSIDPSRFAPPGSDSLRGGPAEPDGAAEDLFFRSDEGTYFEEAVPESQYETVPGYGDDDLLPYPEDELAAIQPRRSRRVPLAIAGLLAVLVIGGVTVVMLRSGGATNPPPIIVADAAPTKITPEDAGTSEGDGQSKLIYDRVDPGSDVADSQLIVGSESPIADIPPIPTTRPEAAFRGSSWRAGRALTDPPTSRARRTPATRRTAATP